MLEFFANLPFCRIGLEACGGAHYWARELTKLGHEMRLMPPQYVKPYVKTNKHDAADAEGCCEAVQRPNMRFVPVKTEQQQALLMLHRIRDRLNAERTGTINAIRGEALDRHRSLLKITQLEPMQVTLAKQFIKSLELDLHSMKQSPLQAILRRQVGYFFSRKVPKRSKFPRKYGVGNARSRLPLNIRLGYLHILERSIHRNASCI